MKSTLRLGSGAAALFLMLVIGFVEISYVDWGEGNRWSHRAARDGFGVTALFMAAAAFLVTIASAVAGAASKGWGGVADWVAAAFAGLAGIGTAAALFRVPREYDMLRAEDATQGLSPGWFVVAFGCVALAVSAVAVSLVPERALVALSERSLVSANPSITPTEGNTLNTSVIGKAMLVLGIILIGWGIVKMSILGFYDGEFVPLIIVPMLLGAALCLGASRLLTETAE